mgnify:CR=1 FL=1
MEVATRGELSDASMSYSEGERREKEEKNRSKYGKWIDAINTNFYKKPKTR